MLTTDQLQLLQKWDEAKRAAAIAKDAETSLREMVAREFFPSPSEGTQRIELPAGWALKLVAKTNYTFDDNEKLHDALTEIEATGNEGAFIAQRLVKMKPSLVLSEYKGLAEKYRVIIDKVITSKPALPALEIEEPRKK